MPKNQQLGAITSTTTDYIWDISLVTPLINKAKTSRVQRNDTDGKVKVPLPKLAEGKDAVQSSVMKQLRAFVPLNLSENKTDK